MRGRLILVMGVLAFVAGCTSSTRRECRDYTPETGVTYRLCGFVTPLPLDGERRSNPREEGDRP